MRVSERHLAGRHGLAGGRPRRARRAPIRRLSWRMAAGSVLAALVVGLTAAPALALTWTVHPGGTFSGAAIVGSTVITDTATHNSVTCTHSKIIGHLNGGNHANGNHIGTITNAIFTSCSGGFAVTAVAGSLPWFLNAVGYNSASRITSGDVTGIQLNLSHGTCSAVVGGMINFNYSNNDYALKFIPTAASLSFTSVSSGCGTTFATSDPATYTATYAITPHQKIIHP